MMGVIAKVASNTNGTFTHACRDAGLASAPDLASMACTIVEASTTIGREQPGGTEIKHDRHEDVDRCGGEGGSDRACRRRRHEEPQDINRERAAERIDQPDEERRGKSAADRADAAD